MKVVKVKKDEVKFLRDLKNSVLSSYLDNAHFDSKSASLVLMLETIDLDKIAEELTNILMDKGMTNSEINKFGKQIDDYLDKFNPYE